MSGCVLLIQNLEKKNNMTARELIKALQDLGEENLDREIIMFDGPDYYTPFKVEILTNKFGHLQGKILID